MTPSGVHVNKPLVGLIVGISILVIVGYKYSDQLRGAVTRTDMAEPVKTAKTELAKDSAEYDKIPVKEDKLKIQVDNKDVTVFYRQAEPEVCSLDVLFLHGHAFKSETWVTKPMWSLQILSKLGYNVVAIDLPGYGNSPDASGVDPANYLEEVIKGLKLKKPVIISPSMSGSFSLPYIFKDPGKVLERARGFVPVAPVGTDKYTKEQYEALKLPTLIIYGDKDKSLGPTSAKKLQLIPDSRVLIYEDSNHPAYLNRPEDFHNDLHKFFQSILNSET